ncbi:hypothetical protein ACJWDR_44700 [Streptomyces tauricus]|uniref:phosphorylase family protein n=1 Tax=Streptomyces tauricus TaxID=68274 RepID=UPI00387F291C
MLTALEVEYRAVREHLVALRPQSDKGTLFEVGWLNGTPWQVALAEIGEGNQGAAVITERAAALFHPRAVVFAGVAGALKDDVRLGDVVVATRVYAYHGGKEENGEFLARPRAWEANYELEQLARHVRRVGSWVQSLPGSEPEPDRDRRPGVHLKPIAAGEIVLDSSPSQLRVQLRRHYQDAAAIEMESAGVAQAAHLNAGLPTLIVRGVSDPADGSKHDTDRAGWQDVAARNAAAFAFSVVRELPVEDDETSSEASPEVSAVFVSSATSLPSKAPATVWRGGVDVACGERLYLLHDDLLEEHSSPDGSFIVRQALARQLKPEPVFGARYVWLRQAEARRGTDSHIAGRALAAENDLLRRLQGQNAGLPSPGLLASHGHTLTLALPWPASHALSGPCPTLGALLDDVGELTPGRLRRLLRGLAGLCTALARLHRERVTHRLLTPFGIIEHDEGSLTLRDLGLAAHAARPGEGPDPYQAPEQQQRRRAARGKTGPWTDVHRLGGVAYRLITGHLPTPGTPLPLRAYVPDVPERVDDAILAALTPDPAVRPSSQHLREALLRGRDDLWQDLEGHRGRGA